MNNHILLPSFNYEPIILKDEHEKWIKEWLYALENNIENGDVAMSECFQGLASEIALYGDIKTDWTGIVEKFLTDDSNTPLAYSEQYGKRLFNFKAQWKQTTINAIYNHKWINDAIGKSDDEKYINLIHSLIQDNGWIYNPEVSNTQTRTRMKSELLMSMAMGTEILSLNNISEALVRKFSGTLSAYSMTDYLGAEYFRICALKNINKLCLKPVGFDYMIKNCESDLGYCDFDVSKKIDDYMGTKKRTQRDKSIHSPLTALFLSELLNCCDLEEKDYIVDRLVNYASFLNKNPLSIPAFRMRDIEAPFGTDITPLEIISSSLIIKNYLV